MLRCCWLLALAGCSIFRPYRIPTPATPDDIKQQQKAKALKAKEGAKAAKKAKAQQAAGEEETTVAAAPVDEAAAGPDGEEAKKKLPKASKVRYDNNGLMKRPKLIRRRYHKPVSKGFHPIDGIKNFFSRLAHGKPKQKPSGKGKKDQDQPDASGDGFPPSQP